MPDAHLYYQKSAVLRLSELPSMPISSSTMSSSDQPSNPNTFVNDGRTYVYEPPTKESLAGERSQIGAGFIGTPYESVYTNAQNYASGGGGTPGVPAPAPPPASSAPPAISNPQPDKPPQQFVYAKDVSGRAGVAPGSLIMTSRSEAMIGGMQVVNPSSGEVKEDYSDVGAPIREGIAGLPAGARNIQASQRSGDFFLQYDPPPVAGAPSGNTLGTSIGGRDFVFGISQGVADKIAGQNIPITVTPDFQRFLLTGERVTNQYPGAANVKNTTQVTGLYNDVVYRGSPVTDVTKESIPIINKTQPSFDLSIFNPTKSLPNQTNKAFGTDTVRAVGRFFDEKILGINLENRLASGRAGEGMVRKVGKTIDEEVSLKFSANTKTPFGNVSFSYPFEQVGGEDATKRMSVDTESPVIQFGKQIANIPYGLVEFGKQALAAGANIVSDTAAVATGKKSVSEVGPSQAEAEANRDAIIKFYQEHPGAFVADIALLAWGAKSFADSGGLIPKTAEAPKPPIFETTFGDANIQAKPGGGTSYILPEDAIKMTVSEQRSGISVASDITGAMEGGKLAKANLNAKRGIELYPNQNRGPLVNVRYGLVDELSRKPAALQTHPELEGLNAVNDFNKRGFTKLLDKAVDDVKAGKAAELDVVEGGYPEKPAQPKQWLFQKGEFMVKSEMLEPYKKIPGAKISSRKTQMISTDAVGKAVNKNEAVFAGEARASGERSEFVSRSGRLLKKDNPQVQAFNNKAFKKIIGRENLVLVRDIVPGRKPVLMERGFRVFDEMKKSDAEAFIDRMKGESGPRGGQRYPNRGYGSEPNPASPAELADAFRNAAPDLIKFGGQNRQVILEEPATRTRIIESASEVDGASSLQKVIDKVEAQSREAILQKMNDAVRSGESFSFRNIAAVAIVKSPQLSQANFSMIGTIKKKANAQVITQEIQDFMDSQQNYDENMPITMQIGRLGVKTIFDERERSRVQNIPQGMQFAQTPDVSQRQQQRQMQMLRTLSRQNTRQNTITIPAIRGFERNPEERVVPIPRDLPRFLQETQPQDRRKIGRGYKEIRNPLGDLPKALFGKLKPFFR